jgi:hypothetical protein
MKAKFINEAIKHLKPRTDEEIWSFINDDEWSYHEDYHDNYELYKKLIIERPFIKEILEDILGTSPENRIQQIDKYKWHNKVSRFTFWFQTFSSMTVYFKKSLNVEILLNHKVNVQVPGNTDYNFSVTIWDEEPEKPKEVKSIPTKSINPMKGRNQVIEGAKIKHLKYHSPEELKKIPDPPSFYESLTPEQQNWFDTIVNNKKEIRELYYDKWYRNGGWNGMIDAINAYIEKEGIPYPPGFEDLETIWDELMNEL